MSTFASVQGFVPTPSPQLYQGVKRLLSNALIYLSWRTQMGIKSGRRYPQSSRICTKYFSISRLKRFQEGTCYGSINLKI